jgi:hypothetical protein
LIAFSIKHKVSVPISVLAGKCYRRSKMDPLRGF